MEQLRTHQVKAAQKKEEIVKSLQSFSWEENAEGEEVSNNPDAGDNHDSDPF